MAVRLAVAVGLLAVAGALIAVLSQPVDRFAGSNTQVVDPLAGVVLPPGTRACQKPEDVPAGAARVKLIVSTGGKPGSPLALDVEAPGGRWQGRGPAGYVDSQDVSVPVRTIPRRLPAATVCIANPGPVQVAVLGVAAPPARAAHVSGRTKAALSAMRLEWHRGGGGSRISQAGDVARRAGLGKASFFGSWTLWAALALTALASALAIALVTREAKKAAA